MNEYEQAVAGLDPAEGGDEYAQAVRQVMQPQGAVQARLGFMQGFDHEPDSYAESKRVAASTGVPVDTVLALPKETRKQAAMGSIDFDTLAATAPATAALLADVQKASVAHDDVGNLQALEGTLSAVGAAARQVAGFVGDTGAALASAVPKFNEGAWGLLRAGGDMLPSVVGQPIADFAARMQGGQRNLAQAWMPKAEGLLGASWYSGMQSAGLNLLQLPLAFIPGGQEPLAASIAAQVTPRMSPVLWSMGAVTGGEAYGKARDQGVGVLPSLAFGASQGVIEAGTEMIGMPKLFSLLNPGGFAHKAGEYMVREQFGEQLATHLQDLNEWAALPENKAKPFTDYLHERPAAAVQTALSVLFAGGAQAGAVHGVGRVLHRAQREAEQVQAAEQQAQLLQQIGQLAQADKLLAREPETFQAFIEEAAQDGPVEHVYLDGNVLMQSGLAEQVAQLSPAVAEQLQEAAITGGQVAIPVSEYASRIASTEQGAALIDHLKTDPEGFSRAEAQQWMQEHGQQLQQDITQALTQSTQSELARASQDAVRTQVLDQLNAAQRFTPQVNETYAALVAARYAARAEQLGMAPEALFAERGLRVTAEDVTGAAFGQAETSAARKAGDAWRAELAKVNPSGMNYVPEMGTPAVLSAMGQTNASLGLPSRALLRIAQAHGEVPLSVVQRLPELMHDPLFVIPHKEGGVTLVLDAQTGKGEPILVGVRDGRVRTVYAKNDRAGMTGQEAVARDVAAALGAQGAKVYARNNEALVRTRASVSEGYGAGSLHPSTRDKARVLTRETLVKRHGDDFYQGDAARGAFSPEQRTIALLRAADLSTFLHEAGHFFFEDDIAMAADVLARQQQGDRVSEGEQRLLADVATLMNWHGMQGDVRAQLAEWFNLPFEEKRAHHERVAESFERYLLEGRAPRLELVPVFQRFRTWLTRVYQSLKDFLAGHPRAGQLSPEVRAVFDRMLATEDQITLAEQGRSLVPLFESADAAGMTPEEFAAYQAEGRQATADAVDDLSARALRDMKWLRNARSRELKRLQQEAGALRDEQEIEARTQVFSDPLYRAWRFLTNRITEEDKLPEPVKTSTGQTLNPEQDSLLVAIAKLGGVARESAATHLGVHADNFNHPSGVFGAPVFRKTGGLAADAMLERLQEAGYVLPERENADKSAMHQLEEKIAAELRGEPQYSFARDWSGMGGDQKAGEGVDVSLLGAARLDATELATMGLPPEVLASLKARHMVAKNGLHPDFVAEQFGFTSGDELVRRLAAAETPSEMVQALTDVRMLEAHGELATPEAVEQAADAAIHNEARLRMLATEEAALAQATGKPKLLQRAAREYAATAIARQRVRDLRPGQYTNAESRAAREAAKARKAGDLARAAAEKRNQVLQATLAREALQARAEVEQTVRYLRRFDERSKGLDAGYAAQIEQLLERFDLGSQSLRAIDKRTSLAQWVEARREEGFEPDIAPELLNEAQRQHYKNLTIEELRGLRDAVQQIEHLGRLKNRLLTQRSNQLYAAVRDEIAAGIEEHARGRHANTRTPTTQGGKALQAIKLFGASHIKVAQWARIMDGGRDGGPVWEHFVRGANERGDMEGAMRAEATAKLSAILEPVRKLGAMSGKGTFFASIGRSLNRQERLAIALNTGNEGNLQRLLDGEGWTQQQLQPVLNSLSSAEWHAVQAIWDHLESYRPLIAAKETRVYGKEPEWVAARPFDIVGADGIHVILRGGYYPVKYDPAASQRAEEHADAEDAQRQLRGAYTSATTRRSFTKARAEAVKGRPLLYSLAGVYSGVNDVIHDLAWHEWLIDTNRLLRSQTIDSAIREHYGPQVKQQLKTWAQDIAEGDRGVQSAAAMAAGRLRQGVSVAGLGFNVMSAAMQPLGLSQSIVRIGAAWVGRGLMQYVANPVRATREANELSTFMANRTRTRFRELNELRNQVQDQSAGRELMGRYAYWLMLRAQQIADVPTWHGAYAKALAEGNTDERAVALADQAVIDSQGGGETKDLSAIERGDALVRLLTVFYSFMNTALNLGVSQVMTADTPAKRAKLAADMLLLYTVPSVFGELLKNALTPGDGEDGEKLLRKLIGEQIAFLFGLFVVGREFADAGKIAAGAQGARDYQGPAGTRVVSDAVKFTTQAGQGEFDDAFRKALVNLAGSVFGLPAAQINRTITGAKALNEGETQNPAALAFGFQKPR